MQIDFPTFCEREVAAGRNVPPWRNADQMRYIAEHYPSRVRHLLPKGDEARRLGIPVDVMPFGDGWRERFLQTLADDAEFRATVAQLLGGNR